MSLERCVARRVDVSNGKDSNLNMDRIPNQQDGNEQLVEIISFIEKVINFKKGKNHIT